MKRDLSVLAGALVLSLLPLARAQGPAADPGREIVETACNACHVLSGRVGGGYTEQGWSTVLRMMSNHGMTLSEAQLASVKAYLVKTYPERPRPPAVIVPGPLQVSIQAWQVPTPGSRPHDPLATRDGAIWYTGQLSNRLGRVDPRTGTMLEYSLRTAHSGPHGLVEDGKGAIWYTANAAGFIGMLDPQSGVQKEYPLPDPQIRDAHTLVFDQAGILWFTAQVGNRVGRLDPKSGEIRLLTPPTAKSRPCGMGVDSKGFVWYVAFGTNKIGRVDPKTMEIREYALPDAASRPRRMAITADDMIWYADFSRGYLGRLDPASGTVREWASPSGPRSQPYGMSVIDGAIWYSEAGTRPGTVVRFDPRTEKFQSWPIPGGGDIVRNTSVTPDGGFVLANSLTNEVSLVTIRK